MDARPASSRAWSSVIGRDGRFEPGDRCARRFELRRDASVLGDASAELAFEAGDRGASTFELRGAFGKSPFELGDPLERRCVIASGLLLRSLGVGQRGFELDDPRAAGNQLGLAVVIGRVRLRDRELELLHAAARTGELAERLVALGSMLRDHALELVRP